MKYTVTVTRTEWAEIDVEADSEEEAKEAAYLKAVDNYEDQCWETSSMDAFAEEGDEDDEEEEEDQLGDKNAAAMYALNTIKDGNSHYISVYADNKSQADHQAQSAGYEVIRNNA